MSNRPFQATLVYVWHYQFQCLNQHLVGVHSVSEKWRQHLLYLFVVYLFGIYLLVVYLFGIC